MQKLTDREKEILDEIKYGVDVFDYFLAKDIRAMEKKYPELLWVGKHMGVYDPCGKLPYLGAIATAKGRKAIGLPGKMVMPI